MSRKIKEKKKEEKSYFDNQIFHHRKGQFSISVTSVEY